MICFLDLVLTEPRGFTCPFSSIFTQFLNKRLHPNHKCAKRKTSIFLHVEYLHHFHKLKFTPKGSYFSPVFTGIYYVPLTYLQLSLDPSFASFPKGHLSLIVLGHDLHKLPGQNRVLRTSKTHRGRGTGGDYLKLHFVSEYLESNALNSRLVFEKEL